MQSYTNALLVYGLTARTPRADCYTLAKDLGLTALPNINAPDESLLLDASHGPSHVPRARRAQMNMPMRARALELDVKA